MPEMKGEFVDCRSLGHAWRYTDVDFDKRAKLFHQYLECSRCETVRITYISSVTGEIARHSTYKYPEGYALKGEGRFTVEKRAKLRLESIKAAARKRNS